MRNEFEKRLHNQIKRRKIKVKYEGMKIPYILEKFYIPDFPFYINESLRIIEGKGQFRREDKAKLAAVKKQHPEIDLRIVFYSFNKQNIRWAEKNAIPWAISKIPKEWLQ